MTSSHCTISIGARLLTIAFAMLLVLPIALLPCTDDTARSEWEKRPLTKLSSVREAFPSEAFFSTVEAYLNDRVFGALEVNRLYRQTQFYVFGDSPVPNVALGPDSLVFLTSHGTVNPLSALKLLFPDTPHSAVELDRALVRLAAAVNAEGAEMLLMVVPSKLTLYADRLPASIPLELRKSVLAKTPDGLLVGQLRNWRKEAPYRVFYPFEEMAALRDEPHFFPPENFHCDSKINHEFAAVFHRKMGLSVGPAFDEGAHLEPAKADLAILGFERQITVWRYPYEGYSVRVFKRVPDWLRSSYARAKDIGVYQTKSPMSNLRALVISNSFGAFISPHLAPGYAELVHVNINNLSNQEAKTFLHEAMQATKPDHVIFLAHDGGITFNGLIKILGP